MRQKKGADKNRRLSKLGLAIFYTSFFMLALFCFSFIAVGEVMFEYALDATFAVMANTPSDLIEEMPTPHYEIEWFENQPKKKLNISSFDNYTLSANLLENDSDIYVISVHGYRGKSTEMTYYARVFYENGYNVLLPDLKGHGQSEGKFVGLGKTDSCDILLWIEHILSLNKNAKIVLHGVSMGASTVMQTIGENPQNVVCAIEDCGYSNAYSELKYVAKNVIKLPLLSAIMFASDASAKTHFGYSLKEIDPKKQVKKSKIATLFIHGSADTFVPFYMLEELYSSAEMEKEKLVVKGATHACSATKNPTLYFETVLKFIAKHTGENNV